jgi:hypothetical protein
MKLTKLISIIPVKNHGNGKPDHINHKIIPKGIMMPPPLKIGVECELR